MKRNFENYKTRHEAYLAYKALKPIPHWFEDDGIPAFIVVDFSEWLWLPVRESGKYTKEDERKYITGLEYNEG